MKRDKLGRFVKWHIQQTKGRTWEDIFGKKRADEMKKNLSKFHTGTKSSEETKKKISIANIGKKRGHLSEDHKRKIVSTRTKNKSYFHTEETKRIISEKNKGHKTSEETREKISNALSGIKRSEATKKKVSDAVKELWKDKSYRKKILKRRPPSYSNERRLQKSKFFKKKWREEEFSSKMLKSLSLKPNKPEKILIGIIQKNNLPFNYVGDGRIWFTGRTMHFNPDFLSKNPKHIIEVFGNYWHNLTANKLRDKERLATYKKYGYRTLVIWDYELIKSSRHKGKKLSELQILNKIKSFIK